MTDDIAKLRELMAKATPGPWSYFTASDANLTEPHMKFLVGANRQGFAHTVGLNIAEDEANANLIVSIHALIAELEAQDKRIGELEKDAARYRWLRGEHGVLFVTETRDHDIGYDNHGDWLRGDAADAAIDAAMSKEV